MRKISRVERLKLALKFYQDGWPGIMPARGPNPSQVKAAPFVWPSWRRNMPQWTIVNVPNYIQEGFEQNAIIYAAISYKIRASQLAPLQAYYGTSEKPERLPPEDPLSRLCSRPNPLQSWEIYAGLGEVYFNLLGNDFIFLDRPRKGEIPNQMYHLRPDRVTIVPDLRPNRSTVMGYVYIPEGKTWDSGIPILPEDMIHIKMPNPGDPLEGLGWGLPPTVPASRSADVDNDVTAYLKMFFEEGAMPPGLLSTDQSLLTQLDIDRMRERWVEAYGGVEHWNVPVIMEKGMTYQRLALSFQEMGFEALDGRNESRIAAPYGVPLILLETRGALSASTYTNKPEARKMFWQDTMIPELMVYQGQYQYYLNRQDGTFVRYDLTGIPALQQDIPALVTAAKTLWDMGEPRFSAYEMVGLQAHNTDNETGSISYLPMSVVPVTGGKPPIRDPQSESESEQDQMVELQREAVEDQDDYDDTEAGAPAPDEPEEEERREGGVKSWSVEVKQVNYSRINQIARSWEPLFEQAAIEMFSRQLSDNLALLQEAKVKSLERKATVNWTDYFDVLTEYYSGQDALEVVREEMLPVIRGVVNDQGEQWAATLGMQFDIRNLEGEDWFNQYTFKFAQEVNMTTHKGLGKMLQQGHREGWTIPQMQKRMTTMFEQYMYGNKTSVDFEWYQDRLPPHRTAMIARTETIRASNAGSHKTFEDWNVKKKSGMRLMTGGPGINT